MHVSARVELPGAGGFWPVLRMEVGFFPTEFPFGFSGRGDRNIAFPWSRWNVLMLLFGYWLVIEMGVVVHRTSWGHYFRTHRVDWLLISFVVTAFAWRMSAEYHMPADAFSQHWSSATWSWFWHRNFVAFSLFASWIKFCEYTFRVPSLEYISATVTKSAGDVARFFVIFSLVFFAFSVAFFLVYSEELEAFRSLPIAAFSLTRALVGALDLAPLFQRHQNLAFVLVTSFQVVSVFFLLTM